MTFQLVIIESPYAGDLARNKRYLQRAILDCIRRGESPYASHQMLTEALNDLDPAERRVGIEAGFAWREATEKTVVYEDYGISTGMGYGISEAGRLQATDPSHVIEYRRIGPNPD